MNLSRILCLSTLVAIIYGGNQMTASERKWIPVRDRIEQAEIFFPHQPIHMHFDLPIEKKEQPGFLDVYSAPIENGLFMFCSLYNPEFTGDELNPARFENTFYTSIIQRMFYRPQDFKNHQMVSFDNSVMNGFPALNFSISFEEHGVKKKIAGIAILRDTKLTLLFYMASEKDFDKELLRRYIDSFHFLEINS